MLNSRVLFNKVGKTDQEICARFRNRFRVHRYGESIVVYEAADDS